MAVSRLYPLLLVLISLLLYGNTVFNGYVLDDGLVITDNKFTQSGIKGIPDILTKDTFYGALGPNAELAGGRYRPLSVVTFALEQDLFQGNVSVRHALNVLLFAGTVLLLYSLLRNWIFAGEARQAFLAALIFAVHPIHTEVVANIKSRDELLSFLFLLLTLMLVLRYSAREKRAFYLVASAACYCLALLSKENGIAFLAVIPLSLWFFGRQNVRSILIAELPLIILAAVYLAVRFNVTGGREGGVKEILNAPYLYATVQQRYATIILVLGRYLRLLLIPYPLTYDYSYNQIPYADFSSVAVWCSVAVHIGLIVVAVLGWKRRSIYSYSILYYIATISIVSNIVVDIGAPMGERLLYQPSLAFCLVAAAGIERIYGRVRSAPVPRTAAAALLALFIILGAAVTIMRNADWKTNETLFLKDLEVSPNSASVNRRAALSLIKLSEQDTAKAARNALLRRALSLLNTAVRIHPTYGDGYLGLGVVFSRLDEVENAEQAWNKARSLNANNYLPPDYENYLKIAYFNKGTALGAAGKFDEARECLLRSLKYGPGNTDALYYLGGAYISLGQPGKAKEAWQRAVALNPNYRPALDRLKELSRQ